MTGTLTELLVAIALFMAAHSGPARTATRSRLTARLGERNYIIIYSIASLVLTVWMITAAIRAPYVELWPQTTALRYVPLVIMPFAVLLMIWGLTTPNPFSIRVDPKAFDPARPGTLAVTRHPILWSFALWSGSHVVPNGDAAAVLMFGLAGLFAVLGTVILDRRRRRELGEAEWCRLAAQTSAAPLVAILAGRAAFPVRAVFDKRLAAAAGIYAALLWLHLPLIGASPFPQ